MTVHPLMVSTRRSLLPGWQPRGEADVSELASYDVVGGGAVASRATSDSESSGTSRATSPATGATDCGHGRHVLQPPHHVQVQASGQEDVGAVFDGGAFGCAGGVVDFQGGYWFVDSEGFAHSVALCKYPRCDVRARVGHCHALFQQDVQHHSALLQLGSDAGC